MKTMILISEVQVLNFFRVSYGWDICNSNQLVDFFVKVVDVSRGHIWQLIITNEELYINKPCTLE